MSASFFETLTDTPNISQGFMFVAFVVLEILGGSISITTLALGGGTKHLGAGQASVNAALSSCNVGKRNPLQVVEVI